MPLTNVKGRESVPGQRITKLKHREQKMVVSMHLVRFIIHGHHHLIFTMVHV